VPAVPRPRRFTVDVGFFEKSVVTVSVAVRIPVAFALNASLKVLVAPAEMVVGPPVRTNSLALDPPSFRLLIARLVVPLFRIDSVCDGEDPLPPEALALTSLKKNVA